ncbi:MAG: tRNA uridine-5-carboxymethylaminomethyl(34) synthesis GTPase MnmE [Muribaculaceae bacterium]|nr:tRNA uridine-5-carboxymethylaminomethyl(34) synthesis GTPase MnmE [Muribaculaceae bacterium]
MTEVNTTICAISTPPGVGGIATARVSGPEAIAIVSKIWKGANLAKAATHTVHLGTILDSQAQPLDQAVATIYRAPKSFTGEDTIEITIHGSRYVQRELITSLINAGAKIAQPGEFTRRAFLSNKINLVEAEAIADIIASSSRAANQIAITQLRNGFSRKLTELREQLLQLASLIELELDFSEEDVTFASRKQLIDTAKAIDTEVNRLKNSFKTGAAIKDGIPVAIAGKTNAGKSSLLNSILEDERAIVSDIHGTTRDIVEENIEIGDYLFRLMDTAGIRSTEDTIEQIGIQRSIDTIRKARLILAVIDSTDQVDKEFIQTLIDNAEQNINNPSIIFIFNKRDISTTSESDLKSAIDALLPSSIDRHYISLSAKNRDNIQGLLQTMTQIIDNEVNPDQSQENILITNARHLQILTEAAQSTGRLLQSLTSNISGELIAQDIRQTIAILGEITGDISSQQILNNIFSRFCIGK